MQTTVLTHEGDEWGAERRLIKTTVETVRTKLDRVYLESLTAARQSGQAQPATEEEVSALQEEVESLYAEILPVAQMSVDQQHLDPALKSLSSRSGQGLARSAVAVSYVRSVCNVSKGGRRAGGRARHGLTLVHRLANAWTTCSTEVTA